MVITEEEGEGRMKDFEGTRIREGIVSKRSHAAHSD
jgi:hypothetical protein